MNHRTHRPARHTFHDGSMVIHGITGPFKGRVSAWFDARGVLVDAEQLVGHRSRKVKVDGPMWSLIFQTCLAATPKRRSA